MLTTFSFPSLQICFHSRASQFYLVIDVSNLTSQEMSLNYTENKNILIEAQESCRVPIPVDRCEVDESVLQRGDELVENENGEFHRFFLRDLKKCFFLF